MKSISHSLIRSPRRSEDQSLFYYFIFIILLFYYLFLSPPKSDPPPIGPGNPSVCLVVVLILASQFSHRFALELMLAALFSCCGLRQRPHEPVSIHTLQYVSPSDLPQSQANVPHSSPSQTTSLREYLLLLPSALLTIPQPTTPCD